MKPWAQWITAKGAEWITAKDLMARWGAGADALAQAVYFGGLTMVVRLSDGDFLRDTNELMELYRQENYPRLTKLIEHGILNPLVTDATAVFPLVEVMAYEKGWLIIVQFRLSAPKY